MFPAVVELNVGGVFYTTSLSTLTKHSDSLLGQIFSDSSELTDRYLIKDSKGKYFLDRDGVLFRYILDFLRNDKLVLPNNFHEKDRLRQEADFFGLSKLVEELYSNSLTMNRPPTGAAGTITIGYRGTFAFGQAGLADVKFRKLSRILICGRVTLCREVFGDSLNESRDPDRGMSDRYTSRFFLKHTFLEQALDNLLDAGFRCFGSCGSGTSASSGEQKPGMDCEENRWNHYNEYLYVRY